MNFFERQHEVRKISARLVWFFALAVIGIVVVVDLAVLLATGLQKRPADKSVPTLLGVSCIVIALIGMTSLFRTLWLRKGGGAAVATKLGGVRVPEDTADPNLRRLRNIVEEIAIASGTQVPQLYVQPQEESINAFAAGWSPADAAVTVTKGALDRLNRDELQGVIAHEFSHVINGDMRLSMRLMGVLFGILGLAVVGRVLLGGGGRRNNNNAGPLIIIALVVMAAGYIGLFAARMIKAAVSRQREYLADASAVQFTRQSAGIAGALKKIGGLPAGSKLRTGNAEDVSHMLFGPGSKLTSMFATHPPLMKRIQVLEPSFNPAELQQLSQNWSQSPPSGLQEDNALGLVGPRPTHQEAGSNVGTRAPQRMAQPSQPAAYSQPPTPTPAAVDPARQSGAAQQGQPKPAPGSAETSQTVRLSPDELVASVGAPGAAAHDYARTVLRSIPEAIQEHARGYDTVVPLVFGLLMSADERVRGQQYRVLAGQHGQPLADAALQENAAVSGLDPALLLPLAQLAFSALRSRPQQDLRGVSSSVAALIQADGRLSVFEYCLSTLLHRELYESTNRAPHGNRKSLASAQSEVALLLAVLARSGHNDPQAAAAAYQAGVARTTPRPTIPFNPPGQGPSALDSVWSTLDSLDPKAKETLVQSMVIVISYDGVLTVAETELVRTMCAMLHCPVPPLRADVRQG